MKKGVFIEKDKYDEFIEFVSFKIADVAGNFEERDYQEFYDLLEATDDKSRMVIKETVDYAKYYSDICAKNYLNPPAKRRNRNTIKAKKMILRSEKNKNK